MSQKTTDGTASGAPDDAPMPGRRPAKAPYEPPTLVTYGEVTEITQSRNKGSRKDGATKGKSRTT